MSELRGRVADAWRAGDAQAVCLLAGAASTVVELAPGEPELHPGALVTLAPSEGAGARVVAVHGGPAGAPWDPEGDATRWRRPAEAPSRMHLLWQRQAALRAIRGYLFDEGFLEVQTPLLVRGTCPDVHLDSLRAGEGYLVTSTEYQLKRLVVGGFEKVFTLTQNFRGGDQGERHNPEFTMLEWARAHAPLDAIERDAEALVKLAFRALHPGRETLSYRGREIRVDGVAWERLTVHEALERHLGLHLAPDASLASMHAEVERLRLDVPAPFLGDQHALFSYLIDAVQPHLGAPTPTFLREWPAFMTSSADLVGDAPALAERSELVIAGLELSDGFPSLRDAALQERFFQRELGRRAREGKEAVALDARYLAALRQGLPPGAGMALGVDRLIMILTGAARIRDVLAFAWDEL
jgi:lysyl-tRNA synthetase class 2